MSTMAGPVAIGTRGTVGSLVRKEIEYFTKVHGSKSRVEDIGPTRGYFRLGFRFFATTLRRKKRLMPRICSSMDVVERNSRVGRNEMKIRGCNYRILEDEF